MAGDQDTDLRRRLAALAGAARALAEGCVEHPRLFDVALSTQVAAQMLSAELGILKTTIEWYRADVVGDITELSRMLEIDISRESS